jgi:chromosome segregation ATPase
MGEILMKEEQLEAIGEYVKKHIADWLKDSNIIPTPSGNSSYHREVRSLDISLTERMVRVEEALKHQGELIEKLLIQMDRRFEQVDKRSEDLRADMNSRFEQVDKRSEDLRADMNSRFEQVDKRFEDLRADMNSRFEQVDKRFEDLRTDMNSRFEQINKRFNQMFVFLTTFFLIIGTLITVFGIRG